MAMEEGSFKQEDLDQNRSYNYPNYDSSSGESSVWIASRGNSEGAKMDISDSIDEPSLNTEQSPFYQTDQGSLPAESRLSVAES